jgi:hypothetical protein
MQYVQAYGGTTSIMIGSYSWSVDSFNPSAAQSGDTYCSSCAVDVSDVTIINSSAVSNTTGKQSVKSRLLQFLRSAHDCFSLLQWLPH